MPARRWRLRRSVTSFAVCQGATAMRKCRRAVKARTGTRQMRQPHAIRSALCSRRSAAAIRDRLGPGAPLHVLCRPDDVRWPVRPLDRPGRYRSSASGISLYQASSLPGSSAYQAQVPEARSFSRLLAALAFLDRKAVRNEHRSALMFC